MRTVVTKPRHPARFSAKILEVMAEQIAEHAPADPLVLDPFGGLGLAHRLTEMVACRVVTSELEPEWASQSPGPAVVGDALALPFRDRSFDVIATSPCYGNRMADHHRANDLKKCEACGGEGTIGVHHCANCNGSGRGDRLTDRNTYRHQLGRELTTGSAAAMQWGVAYRTFHQAAWAAALDAAKPGALILCNVKNHVRRGDVQPVVEWHLTEWFVQGCTLLAAVPVKAPGLRFGQNGKARVDHEQVLVLRAT